MGQKIFRRCCAQKINFKSSQNLNYVDYLIDVPLANGVKLFKGEHIHFGSAKFPD
tara:strand:- start:118 stop:282 length:165 start_codon:yes stop_codon:yes gene_type:complete